MAINSKKLLIITILLIAFLSFSWMFNNYGKETELFTNCSLFSYPNQNIFTPIKMIISDIDRFNISNNSEYLEPNIVLTSLEIKTILDNIKQTPPNNIYSELKTNSYQYNKTYNPTYVGRDVLLLLEKLFSELKTNIENEVKDRKYCISNECSLSAKKYSIIRIGEYLSNKIVEGQLLLTFKNRPIDFLVKFVISDENNFTIHNLLLEGYQYSSNLENTEEPRIKNVEIYGNPLINKYNLEKDYYLSSSEERIQPTPIEIDTILSRRKQDEKELEKCYGKSALNKNECEAEYDIYGRKNTEVGVWDSDCLNDYECPFFQANKNYPNTFGKCVSGKCQMPIGITQISSKKYKDLDSAICTNCITGNNCCKSQLDKSIYKNLASPDYRFINDIDERNKYSPYFTDKGLKVI